MATKNQNGFNHEFDFTKNFEPKDNLGEFMKKSMIAFYAKLSDKDSRKWISKMVKMVVLGAIVCSGFSYFKTYEEGNTKVQLAQMAQKEQQIKAVMPQNIRAIKMISQDNMAKTIAFIKNIQANQEKRLVNFYWNSEYAFSGDEYILKKAVAAASEVRTKMNNYYNEQISLISKTYNAVQRGDTIFSNPESLEQVVYWNDAMNNNLQPNLEEVSSLLNDWDSKFIDKKGFNNYLETNKNMIATTSPYH